MEHRTEDGMRKISAAELLPLMEMVENGECVLIDVRSPHEFDLERIDGARNVPVNEIANMLRSMDRATPLLIYCKVGKRCVKAAEQLSEMGFEDVKVLDGGIEAWKARRHR